MADESVQAVGAPAAEPQGLQGVGSEKGNMTLAEVAGEFMRASQETVEPTGEEVPAEGDGEAVDGQPDAEPETDGGSESDPEPESEESDESEEDDVLSQLKPNAAKKAKKRIDKLTARAKEAEERLAERERVLTEMQQRLQALEQGGERKQEQTKEQGTFSQKVKTADTHDKLQQLYETAKQARKWAREHLYDEEVVVGEQVLDRREVTRILNEAEEAIETYIPQQAKSLQMRTEAEQNAMKDFPAWGDEKSPDHARLKAIYDDREAGAIIKALPNGKYLAGVFLEGLKALESRKKQPEEKKEAPKKQPVAPRVPSVGDGVSPSPKQPAQGIDSRFSDRNLTHDDMVALFAEKERARSKQR
jgi:hypothetical protein